MASPLDRIADRLAAGKRLVRRNGTSLIARCPAHEDDRASLSASTGRDGRALLKCHAGCRTEAIVAALGLTMQDLFPDTGSPPRTNGNGTHASAPPRPTPERPALVKSYDYVDESGRLLYQACRFEPKTFRQRRPDGNGGWIWNLEGVRLVPYRLPEVIEAAAMGRRIFVVEGEKDADALWAEGVPATTSPMGAGKWRDEYARFLAGAEVVILPDHDEPGRQHAEMVAGSLTAARCTVRVVQLPGVPEKGDVSDWLEAGGDFDDLDELIARTPIWCPDPSTKSRWRLDELLANEEIMRPPMPVIPRLVWGGRSSLLAARDKAGKSTLVGYLAAAVSHGGEFLGDPCQQGTVLIVALEEYIGDVGRRLKHFGAQPERIYVVDRLSADPRERPEALSRHIETVKPVLVVVDTLMAYARGIVEDENAASQMQPVVQALTDLAHRHEVAVLLVHHNNKGDTYRGSTAIGGAVDVLVEMTTPDEQTDPTRRKMRCVGRLPVHGFEMRYDGQRYDLTDGQSLPLIQRVLNVIRANPGLSTARLREIVGGRKELVDAAISNLWQRRYITDEGDPQSGHRWMASVAAPASIVGGSPQ